MRIAAAIAFLFLASNTVDAGEADRYALTLERTFPGTVTLISPSELLVVNPLPPWDASAPALALHSFDGTRSRSALAGLDVRAAIPWGDGFLCVVTGADRTRLIQLTHNLGIARELDIAGPLGALSDPVRMLGDSGTWACVVVDGRLLSISTERGSLTTTLLEDRIRGIGRVDDIGAARFAVVSDVGNTAYLTVFDTTFRRRVSPNVPLAEHARISTCGGRIVVRSPIDDGRGTQITIVDPISGDSRFLTLAVPPDLVVPVPSTIGITMAIVNLVEGRHTLVLADVTTTGDVLPSGTVLPADLGLPRAVRVLGDTVIIMFAGGIVTASVDGSILSQDAVTFRSEPSDVQVTATKYGFLISSIGGSALVSRTDHPFWWFFRFIDTALKYVVPIVLILFLVVTYSMVRRQRRFIDAMIDLPGAGIVLLLDSNGRLLRTNERAAALLRISSATVPMRRQFRSYMVHADVAELLGFITQATTTRASMSEKVVVYESGAAREIVCTSIPLRGSFGRYNGALVTGVDITEALERRRLVNWAQLAHDMQTNLSTIRLNAEQLDPAGSDTERRRRILFQVGVLIQRVRDLVGVGRSEDLDRAPVHSAELCTEIRHEFDPAMFPHVAFQMKLRGTMMNVDRLKLSRAIRNAVENGIKALRGQHGTIEIATWYDRTNVYIRISDTGVGMDEKTLADMMIPYFTTARDGSGTGIGTMIMQHVVHLHGGSLRVTSKPGEGTQIVFRIPHGSHPSRVRHERLVTEQEETL